MIGRYSQSFVYGSKDFRNLKVSDTLKPGSKVTAGDRSRVALVLADESIVRSHENTKIKLMRADMCNADKGEVKIFIERVYISLNPCN